MNNIGFLIESLNAHGLNRQAFLDHEHFRKTKSLAIPPFIDSYLWRFSRDFVAIHKTSEKLRHNNFDETDDPLMTEYLAFRKSDLVETRYIWSIVEGTASLPIRAPYSRLENFSVTDCADAARFMESHLNTELYELFFALLSRFVYCEEKSVDFHTTVAESCVQLLKHMRETYTIDFTQTNSKKQKKVASTTQFGIKEFVNYWLDWCGNDNAFKQKCVKEIYDKKRRRRVAFFRILWDLFLGTEKALMVQGQRITLYHNNN
jgi:mRNA-degrading endonuclease RelE of RelBE toxin-antitoxin system